MAITAYGHPLTTFPSLKYLSRILLALYGDCQGLVHNLRKLQNNWALLSQVMGR